MHLTTFTHSPAPHPHLGGEVLVRVLYTQVLRACDKTVEAQN